MKRRKNIFIVLLFLLLVGCTRAVNATEVIQLIQQAAENNQQLENGTFETLLSKITDDDEAENSYQKMGGSFVKNAKETLDWHFVTYFPGKNELISYELIDKGKGQFQKVIEDPLEFNSWMPVEQPLLTANHFTILLSAPEIVETQIADIDVEMDENCTRYQLNMSEEFATQRQQTEIAHLQEGINGLKRNKTGGKHVHHFETYLEQIQAVDYLDVAITYEIDANNILTKVEYVSRVQHEDGNRFTLLSTFSLMDYNIPNAANLFPNP